MLVKELTNLSNQRREQIVSLASEVFLEHFGEPPADPLHVFDQVGITYSFGHYGDSFDGLLEYEDGSFHVFCNVDRENEPGTPRSRFTLAHELAHYFIDEHREALIAGRVNPHPSKESGASADLLPEREADLFASSFLMPAPLLMKAIGKLPSGYETIRKLAEMFQVSIRCAAIRYVESGAYPAAIIFWGDQEYRWKRVSPVLWNMGCRKSLEEAAKIPKDSATGQMISNEDATKSVVDGHSLLGFWFPMLQRAAFRELVVREQAINLGRFGTLTVIEPLDWKLASQDLKFTSLVDSMSTWSSN